MPFSARTGFFSQAEAGPTLWTPADITTQVWVDAAADQLTLSGTDVSNWNNKANGTSTVDFSNAIGSEQPTWDSANVGVYFDGVDDYLQADSRFSFSGNPDFITVAVVTVDAYSSYFSGVADKFYQLGGNPGGGTNGVISIAAGSGSVGWNYRHNNGFDSYGGGVLDAMKLTSWQRASGTNYGAGDRMFLDGTERTGSGGNTNAPNIAQNYSYLGGGPGGNIGQFMYANCWIHELVCIEDNTTTNRQLLEGYMAWRWGLEANLPVSHPYKSEGPTV